MEEALLEWVGQAAHPAVFLGLLSTGVPGVPVAEEAVLLAAGAAVAGSPVGLAAMVAVACVGLFLADTALFRIGVALGPKVVSHRWFAPVLTPARVARVQRGFERFGARAVFGARFTPGLRMPSFLLAGAFGVRQSRFWLAHGLGVLICAPLVVGLGAVVGPPALALVRSAGGWAITLTVLAAAGVALYLRRATARRPA